MISIRRLGPEHMADAAAVHRAAAGTIPDFPNDLHTPDEDRDFYALVVFEAGPVWGAFEGDRLVGHVALTPGWIDHLYVLPARHGRGVGRALLAHAQNEQSDLQLWTFESNARARRFYEAAGFVEQERTDGAANEERMPDIRYRWRRRT